MKQSMINEITTTKHYVIYLDLIKLIYLIIKTRLVVTSVHYHLINMI